MNHLLFSIEDFDLRTMSQADIEPTCDFISTQHAQHHALAFTYNNDPKLIRPYMHDVLSNKTNYEYSIVIIYRPTGEIVGSNIASDFDKLHVPIQPINDEMIPIVKFGEFLIDRIYKIGNFNPKECVYYSNYIVHRKFKGRGLGVAIVQATIQSLLASKYKYTIYLVIGNGSRSAQYQVGSDSILGTFETKNFEVNGKRPFESRNTTMILSAFQIPSAKL